MDGDKRTECFTSCPVNAVAALFIR